MKTKFTLLIIAGLFFAVSTQAQNRDHQYNRHDDYNYKTHMYDLQQKLNYEMSELDRAKACRDWRKVQAEKREIAEIRDEMRHTNYRKWVDQQNDFSRNHDYNNGF